MNEYIRTTERGAKYYFKDKEMTILHREDGPAIEWITGSTSWYFNDKRHRIDGPSTNYVDTGAKSWYINGVHIFTINNDDTVIHRMK